MLPIQYSQYSLPSVGPGADPGVQAVIPHWWLISQPPGDRLPYTFHQAWITFPAGSHRASPPLGRYQVTACSWWQKYIGVNNLPKVVRPTQIFLRVGLELMTCWSQVQRSTRCATAPPYRRNWTVYFVETCTVYVKQLVLTAVKVIYVSICVYRI